MTVLRQRFIEDLRLQGKSERTQRHVHPLHTHAKSKYQSIIVFPLTSPI